MAIVCLSFLLLHTLPRAWNTLNTDFPNYYLTAQLARDGVDTSRAYEWRWLQRQKDQTRIDQRVVGLVPITPFSTLLIWPLSHLEPLAAKRTWLIFNLGLLIPIALALRDMTKQPLRRIILVIASCVPLYHNLLFGQYYILLLALLVFACSAYIRRLFLLTGTLIALAAALKIFPAVFLVYLVRKKNWSAFLSTVLTLLVLSLVSILIFGWGMHRTYLSTVLPWTLRGEALPPYILASSSISTLLHHLFLFEPQWNPHPWIDRPALYAILQPFLQTLILAPAILLVQPHNSNRRRICIEWSALITATLAISTVPASYNFTLMIFPSVVLYGALVRRHARSAAGVVLLYLAIGYSGWNTAPVEGLRALFHVPRLYFLLLFLLVTYRLLGTAALRRPASTVTSALWLSALIAITLLGIHSNLQRNRHLYADYAYRVPEEPGKLLSSDPKPIGESVASIALVREGYRFASSQMTHVTQNQLANTIDELSFAYGGGQLWIEQSDTVSQFATGGAEAKSPALQSIAGAHSPVLSLDHQHIAYLRSTSGRDRAYEKSTVNTASSAEMPLTPANLNVEEATLLGNGSAIVSALSPNGRSLLYRVDNQATILLSAFGEARYPAVSPDGRWLAYSRFTAGVWNLWVSDLHTGALRRIADVPCNQIEASWQDDSETLLYASDCGRALWFTAVCRRKIINP